MSDDLGCIIDEEFKKQLESATSQTPLTVIATIRETFKVHNLIKNLQGYARGSPEQQQARLAVKEAETRMMEPVCKYLDSLGVQYNPLTSIHVVTAQMTPKQILDFTRLPYVQIVSPDAEVVAID